MADHHVDSLNINYTKAAKHILQSHGLYIANAPDINHKPGNDFYSDWTWPFPTYPDNRFQNPTEDNLDIKDDNKHDKEPETPDERRKFPENFQILSEELKSLKNIKNPMVSNLDPHDGEEFGYVLQGKITLVNGEDCFEVKKGETFYLKGHLIHLKLLNLLYFRS